MDDELWTHFKSEYWNHFIYNTVEEQIKTNPNFISRFTFIKDLGLFDNDICKALAILRISQSEKEFSIWLNQRIPALNNSTPKEIMKNKNGKNWLREYILRYGDRL